MDACAGGARRDVEWRPNGVFLGGGRIVVSLLIAVTHGLVQDFI